MTTTLPTVILTFNKNGTYRYTVDGVVHTKGSRRVYTHASVYVHDSGDFRVWLHSRADLAAKGNPDANKWSTLRKVGHVAIIDRTGVPTTNAAPEAPAATRQNGQPVTDAYRARVIADATPMAAPADRMALRAVRVPDALWDAAKAAAADNGTSVSDVIRAALESYASQWATGARV